MQTEFDLCVIEGGAIVALVEKCELGGDCLRYGCMPSKALLHADKIAQTMREAATLWFAWRRTPRDV